jgi:hypothetical protein
MKYSLNEYNKYRKHKLNIIHKRVIKCYDIINNVQTGGKEDITKDKIDSNFDFIKSKLQKLGDKLEDTTGMPCCEAYKIQIDKIKELIDVIKNS